MCYFALDGACYLTGFAVLFVSPAHLGPVSLATILLGTTILVTFGYMQLRVQMPLVFL